MFLFWVSIGIIIGFIITSIFSVNSYDKGKRKGKWEGKWEIIQKLRKALTSIQNLKTTGQSHKYLLLKEKIQEIIIEFEKTSWREEEVD